MIKDILLLGNPALYEIAEKVTEDDLEYMDEWLEDLHDTLMEYKRVHGAGRAIAAPQIGVKKRILYMYTDREYVFINPVMEFPDDEMYELLDDCMSFPGLCVKVRRHKRAIIRYFDRNMEHQSMELSGDYSELLQHEYDHLDGILAVMRAVDDRSLFMMEMKR